MLLEYFVVCGVALIASGLTLFSGFGLGTVIMPTFALFFPIPVAVAAAAVVHLANNLFKVFLVGRKADWPAVLRFALPAAFAAIIGAALLGLFEHISTFLKLAIGILVIFFSFFDLLPRLQNLSFDRKYLSLGGLLSGFFGGLSGFQGALRSAFLMKVGLEKEAFIGTGTVAAVIVDVARLAVYGMGLYATKFAAIPAGTGSLILAATLAAFVGAFFGARMMKKVTLQAIQVLVGIMLIAVGLGMASGLF
ncbi:MAG: TSUP family transporter [Deltaproteobacteria bacterium]|nr:TSUP family transporter [Deltaproteobacteria bacterium]